jgi:hypothetical protein
MKNILYFRVGRWTSEEIKSEYSLCINNPQEYQKKVDTISKLFRFTGKRRLKGDNCPIFVVGKYDRTLIRTWLSSW